MHDEINTIAVQLCFQHGVYCMEAATDKLLCCCQHAIQYQEAASDVHYVVGSAVKRVPL